jgi:hypothetical protein
MPLTIWWSFLSFFIFDIILQKYMAVQYVEWTLVVNSICQMISTNYDSTGTCIPYSFIYMYVRIILYRRITYIITLIITSFMAKK